jgi:DNA-damage-inducible protein J
MPISNINIRVDSEVKSQAQDVFASLGLDMTTAINVFLRQAILQRGIPFSISANVVKKVPKPGSMKDKIWIADDFDATLEDFEDYMP